MKKGAKNIENIATTALVPYARNARMHSDSQVKQIAASIKEFGFNNPVLIDDQNGIISGHGRVMAASLLGLDAIPCVRLSHLSEAEKRAYVLIDNRLAENSFWDTEMLKIELDDLTLKFDMDLRNVGFSDAEMEALLAIEEPKQKTKGSEDIEYTGKIVAPIYTPKGEKPPVATIFDLTKTNELLAKIEKMNIGEEEKNFLRFAAYRHTSFNFTLAAEYYAHASPEMQDAMEQSALVIIDYNKAIEYGFAKLTKEIAEAADA